MIKIKPIDLIEEARAWIGTKYHHQQSSKGLGCDCIGLPKGILKLYGCDVSAIPVTYSRLSNPELMMDLLDKSDLVTRCEDNIFKPARLILFKVHDLPHHFGIINENCNGFIHSHYKYGVMESDFNFWNSDKLYGVWKFNIADESE